MRDDERSEYGQRLLEARTKAGLRQVDLAAKAGVSQGTLADLEKQGRASKFTSQLAIACGVRPQWLATGEGPMLDADSWPFKRIDIARVISLNPEALAYLEGRLESALETVENLTSHHGKGSSGSATRGVPPQFPGEILSTGRGRGASREVEVDRHAAAPPKRGSKRA